ncbi:hypothetical protein GCM10027258_62180 [Amycolatopsis stemonae]
MGWRDEHIADAELTTGKFVKVVTGKTRDPRNPAGEVGALGIPGGPTLVLRNDGRISNGPEIISNMRQTLAELLGDERRGGV